MTAPPVHLAFGIRQLIAKTALQPAAKTRQPGRVQVEILPFGHLDGNWFETVQPRRAAERPPARPIAAEHFGLVTGTNLTHLNSGVEFRGELTHELPEIDAPVSREVENQPRAVKLLFGFRQLHFQVALADFQQRNTVCLLLPLLLLQPGQDILLGGPAKDLHRRAG
jgi:hypothetical protein